MENAIPFLTERLEEMTAARDDAVSKSLDLQSRLSEKQAALYSALATAQGEFETPKKNRTVDIAPRDTNKASYQFRYADMEELIRATRPALTKNGIAVLQRLIEIGDGVEVRTVLAHKGGGTETSHITVFRGNGDMKQFGAAVSYVRRYEYSAILCLAADDDLDEDQTAPGDGERTPAAKGDKPPADEAPARRQPKRSARSQDSGGGLSKGMVTAVRKALEKVDNEERTEKALCEAFEVKAIEDIPKAKVNEALDWAKS